MQFIKVSWMMTWRLFLLLSIIAPEKSSWSIIAGVAFGLIIVFGLKKSVFVFPIIRRLLGKPVFINLARKQNNNSQQLAKPLFGTKNVSTPPPFQIGQDQDESTNLGVMTGYEPKYLKHISVPIGGRVVGEPGSGLQNASSIDEDNAKLGIMGEQLFSKALKKDGIINNVDTFWSLSMPSENALIPDSKYDTDIDCVIALGNTLLLVDLKYYTGGQVVYRSHEDQLYCLDGVTGGLINQKSMSSNMKMAYERFAKNLPQYDVNALVVFIPTNRGVGSIDNVFWPENIPAVNLPETLNYLHNMAPTSLPSDKNLRRELYPLLR